MCLAWKEASNPADLASPFKLPQPQHEEIIPERSNSPWGGGRVTTRAKHRAYASIKRNQRGKRWQFIKTSH
jgi:hypothetical protein